VTVGKLATETGIGQHTVQEMREIWDIGKSMPAGLLAGWRRSKYTKKKKVRIAATVCNGKRMF